MKKLQASAARLNAPFNLQRKAGASLPDPGRKCIGIRCDEPARSERDQSGEIAALIAALGFVHAPQGDRRPCCSRCINISDHGPATTEAFIKTNRLRDGPFTRS